MNFGLYRVVQCVICGLVILAGLRTPVYAGAINTVTDDTRLQQVMHRLAVHQLVRIVAFGSSSTEGIGASSPAATYPSRLQAALAAAWP
jgi:hypothetical protein